eukprot:CAMPEP_0114512778 /NCGR_PEP_ID=MMETSP0109-20121206/15176_1 /TAXON_ID=29199 /ORGANISM="Chlorarachnion reptans, Strain CCCM449" /LENGTH=537 /DNA_ID=CAMNT_0001692523 /DNA_START=46 /DNA_END=1659 /DNA_ORIENTATION=+
MSDSAGRSNSVSEMKTEASTPAHAPIPPPRFVYQMALCACVNSALLGYDTGVLSGALLYLRDAMDLSTQQIELLTSSMNYIAIPGCFLAGYIADAIGRTRTLFAASLTFLVGALLMAGANDYGTLFLGRSLIGVGVGCGLAIDPLYIAEISPPEFRGKLTSYSETAINIGILSGYVSNVAFMWLPKEYNWRVMLAVGAIPPFIMMVLATFVMPDTPRFLISKGKYEEADAVLKRIARSEEEVKLIKHDIKESIAQEKNTTSKEGWKRILCPDPILKRMLMVTLMISVLQQLCGVDVILYYAPIIMEQGGIEDRLAQLGLTALAGVAKVGVLFITMHYLDHKSMGRRPLMLLSYSTLALGTAIISLGFGLDSVGASVFGIIFFCGAFSIGAGPICWLMNSEVLPLPVRARGMTLGCSLNRLASAVLQTVFLSLAEAITPAGAFLFLTLINVFGFVYLYFYMPETKNKTLEEMTNYFASLIGVKAAEGRIEEGDVNSINLDQLDAKGVVSKVGQENSELGGDRAGNMADVDLGNSGASA